MRGEKRLTIFANDATRFGPARRGSQAGRIFNFEIFESDLSGRFANLSRTVGARRGELFVNKLAANALRGGNEDNDNDDSASKIEIVRNI